MSKLLDELEELELTKAERLQLVNLAPTSVVELHVVRPLSPVHSLSTLPDPLSPLQCIEDLEERFPEGPAQDSLLALIKTHLSSVEDASTAASKDAADAAAAREAAQRDKDKMEIDEREAEAVQDDSTFVNEGWDGMRANENAENDIDEER